MTHHRIGVTKIHVGDDGQIGKPFFLNNNFEQCLIIFGEAFR